MGDEHASDLPDEPGSTMTWEHESGTPRRMGGYRILQKIGEGGMGEIYEAEQIEPRRRVALKIIKAGLDTKQVIARFDAERQALATMDHPNVAKVYDAGTTPNGRPYFVMEYVKGVPITEHCDRQRLSTAERLELFRQVCEGVQHAHQKAIIHRDIKPSNVLVAIQDGEAVPKIIDFGVAKATAQPLTERTLVTELGQIIGTPEYMSPEQAEMTGQSVDTRTDIYSLGVVLYEMLVGALPFDPTGLRRAEFGEIRRRIREEVPSKPSTRVGTLGHASAESARNRRTDPRSLARQLRGDLDWITMKALEKDRGRRYASPSALAADIGRYLAHEPVLAGPPSAAYRAGKFVRRHRVGVAAATLSLGVLAVFTVTTTLQSRRIAREARTSERVSEFLVDMLGEVEPEALGRLLVEDLRERIEAVRGERGDAKGEVESVLASFAEAMQGVNATDAGLRLLDEQVLARAGRTIAQELGDEPLIAARLEHTIGVTYRELGLYARAEPHLLRAVRLRRRLLGEDDPNTLDSEFHLADVYWSQARHDRAETLYAKTLEARRRVLGEDHPDTLSSMNNLAGSYLRQGRYAEAEPLYEKVLRIRRRVLDEEDPEILWSVANLGLVYLEQGRYAESEPLQLEALDARRRVLGEDHPNTLSSLNNLAVLYLKQRRYAEAEPLLVEVLEACRRVHGDNHPATLGAATNLTLMYGEVGRHADAQEMLLETLADYGRVLGDDHPDALAARHALADLYMAQRRYADAEPLHVATLDGRLRVLGEDHPDTVGSMYRMACLEAAEGGRAGAMEWLHRAVDAGYADWQRMTEDADLELLFGPDFDAVVERARRNDS